MRYVPVRSVSRENGMPLEFGCLTHGISRTRKVAYAGEMAYARKMAHIRKRAHTRKMAYARKMAHMRKMAHAGKRAHMRKMAHAGKRAHTRKMAQRGKMACERRCVVILAKCSNPCKSNDGALTSSILKQQLELVYALYLLARLVILVRDFSVAYLSLKVSLSSRGVYT